MTYVCARLDKSRGDHLKSPALLGNWDALPYIVVQYKKPLKCWLYTRFLTRIRCKLDIPRYANKFLSISRKYNVSMKKPILSTQYQFQHSTSLTNSMNYVLRIGKVVLTIWLKSWLSSNGLEEALPCYTKELFLLKQY